MITHTQGVQPADEKGCRLLGAMVHAPYLLKGRRRKRLSHHPLPATEGPLAPEGYLCRKCCGDRARSCSVPLLPIAAIKNTCV